MENTNNGDKHMPKDMNKAAVRNEYFGGVDTPANVDAIRDVTSLLEDIYRAAREGDADKVIDLIETGVDGFGNPDS